MWVLLVLVLLLILVLLIRVRFRAIYDEKGFRAFVRILFYKIKLPADKKEKDRKKAEEKEETKGASMTELKELVDASKKVLGKAIRAIRIDKLKADVIIGGEDPFTTAMTYGSVAAGCGILIPPLENTFNIRKKDITVNADFDARETLISFDAKASINICKLAYLAVIFIMQLMKNKKEGMI